MDDPCTLDDGALFLEAPDGGIAFTAAGREFYTSFFGYAGIDIRRIRTKEDLYRRAARRSLISSHS